MNWQHIRVAPNQTYFLIDGKPVFNKVFHEVLKFHAPGLAPVIDESGAYHINSNGEPIYKKRYKRTFGYYCLRATVITDQGWRHIDETGKQAYEMSYSWLGNFQEGLCTVRNSENRYFHIDLKGERIYQEDYLYAGDFKNGVACVKLFDGFFVHINQYGSQIHSEKFIDLGVFHKGYATAKDHNGWHHINNKGKSIYTNRYQFVEPFYNGQALVTLFDNSKQVINENGDQLLTV